MTSRDEVIGAAFAALDRHIRRASIAEIGGFRAPEELTSSYGGRFVASPGDEWPLHDGQPMIPLLQVRIDELPHRPHALDGIDLVNVFVGTRDLPMDLPAENGDGWLLRTYPSLEKLTPLLPPSEPTVRALPVRWHLSEAEGPQWEDAWGLYDLTDFNDLDDSIDLFYDRYSQHLDTKVGGWPGWIQSSIGCDGYVFQIGSNEKSGWMWGDSGNGYVFFRDGKWLLYWDCY